MDHYFVIHLVNVHREDEALPTNFRSRDGAFIEAGKTFLTDKARIQRIFGVVFDGENFFSAWIIGPCHIFSPLGMRK